jgi:hypothetical protein
MQVYRDLRVVTARPTPEEEARAPHRLYGHVDAAVNYSAGQYLRDAGAALAQARENLRRRDGIAAVHNGLHRDAFTRAETRFEIRWNDDADVNLAALQLAINVIISRDVSLANEFAVGGEPRDELARERGLIRIPHCDAHILHFEREEIRKRKEHNRGRKRHKEQGALVAPDVPKFLSENCPEAMQ